MSYFTYDVMGETVDETDPEKVIAGRFTRRTGQTGSG